MACAFVFPARSPLQMSLVLQELLAYKANMLRSHNTTLQAAERQAQSDAEVSAPTRVYTCMCCSLSQNLHFALHSRRNETSDITAFQWYHAIRQSCPAEKNGVLEDPCNCQFHITTAVIITVIISKSAVTGAAHVMPMGLTGPLCAAINFSITTSPLPPQVSFSLPPPVPFALPLSPTPPPRLLVVDAFGQKGGAVSISITHALLLLFSLAMSSHGPTLLHAVLNSAHAGLFSQAMTCFSYYRLLAFTWQPSRLTCSPSMLLLKPHTHTHKPAEEGVLGCLQEIGRLSGSLKDEKAHINNVKSR